MELNNLPPRRYAQVRINPEFFASWFKQGWKIPDYPAAMIECIEGLPTDAKYIRCAYDAMLDEIMLIFEHPSFEPVSYGGYIPTIKPIFKKFYLSVENEH